MVHTNQPIRAKEHAKKRSPKAIIQLLGVNMDHGATVSGKTPSANARDPAESGTENGAVESQRRHQGNGAHGLSGRWQMA